MDKNQTIQEFNHFKQDLSKLQSEVKKLLPEHISFERFERVVLSAIQMNDYLLSLDRKSLFNACLKCAADGLLPDGKEAAIVPFAGEAQYMPMVYGIIKKMRNSGELKTIAANIVYEKDDFQYFVDQDGEHFSHKPQMFGDRGKPIGVYSMIKTKDEALYFDVMSQNEVNAVKASSKNKKNSPWDGTFYLQMWIKTSIRRLSKRVPMSAEVERVIQANDDMIDFNQVQVESKADKIKKLIQAVPEVPMDQSLPDAEFVDDSAKTETIAQPEAQGEFNTFKGSFVTK